MRITAKLLLGLLLSLLFAGAPAAADGCLKQVFNHYCLGGDYEALLRRQPAPLFQQQEGDQRAAVYLQGREKVYVMAFRNRIYKVLRQYRPATHLRYQDLLDRLAGKYGQDRDASEFPDYADNRAHRVGAIRRGDGKAVHSWSPGQGWSVELSWTREMGLSLAYVADQLDAERRAAADSGL